MNEEMKIAAIGRSQHFVAAMSLAIADLHELRESEAFTEIQRETLVNITEVCANANAYVSNLAMEQLGVSEEDFLAETLDIEEELKDSDILDEEL